MLSLRLLIQRGMRITPLGICLRIMVNDKPLNLEKTTSSVLSVLLLIYDFYFRISIYYFFAQHPVVK